MQEVFTDDGRIQLTGFHSFLFAGGDTTKAEVVCICMGDTTMGTGIMYAITALTASF